MRFVEIIEAMDAARRANCYARQRDRLDAARARKNKAAQDYQHDMRAADRAERAARRMDCSSGPSK